MSSTDVETIDDFKAESRYEADVLVLSTVHFDPLEDEDLIAEHSTMSGRVGYLVSCGGEHMPSILITCEDSVSEGLRQALETAREAGYQYILFDRDAARHPNLPAFEEAWETFEPSG